MAQLNSGLLSSSQYRPHMEDYLDLDDLYRLRFIKRTALPEATHVAVSQTFRSEDGDVGVTDARFALERRSGADWVELGEADLSESVYLDTRPKILESVRASPCIAGERLDVEVHVPVLSHRLAARKVASVMLRGSE